MRNDLPPLRNPTPKGSIETRKVSLVLISDGFTHSLQTSDGAIVQGVGHIALHVSGQDVAKMDISMVSFGVDIKPLTERRKYLDA